MNTVMSLPGLVTPESPADLTRTAHGSLDYISAKTLDGGAVSVAIAELPPPDDESVAEIPASVEKDVVPTAEVIIPDPLPALPSNNETAPESDPVPVSTDEASAQSPEAAEDDSITSSPGVTLSPPTSDISSNESEDLAKSADAALEVPADTTPPRDDADEVIAVKVLRIIESYGTNYEKPDAAWKGLSSFIPVVADHVRNGKPVRLVLPAFPCKSPNRRGKVLGALPDLGEELALCHLNGLCENIATVYEHGAEVLVTSDGLVYNDLLGVSDEDVWDYGEALRQMGLDKGLDHIKFIRLWDLLGHPGPQQNSPETAKEFYLIHASCIRRELIFRYQDPSLDANEAIRSDEDTCLIYRGYLKFLTKDLAHREHDPSSSKREKANLIAQTAKSMIVRGKAFAAAIKANMGNSVRLSIHESGGEGKLSMSLIPQGKGALGFTPWHSCVAIGLDGTYRTVHAAEVRETHDLIYKNGRPYYFREKSELFDWGSVSVKFEHLYPCGLVIRPSDIDDVKPPPSIRDIPMRKVRALSNTMSPIIIRGFAETTEEQLYTEKAHEAGEVLPWTFGIIQKVKDAGRMDKMGNNVTSNEAMPMHFDGMFKFEERQDPVTGEVVKVQKPPGYQFFTCLATAPKGSGYTLFASSRLFFRYLPAPFNVDRFEKITWGMDNNGFWDAKLKKLPLVVRHPVDNTPCMRWHQPWDATKTRFSTCEVTIENDDQGIVPVIDQVLYDYRVCSRFTWESGDLLVSDNTAMLHTRTGYKTNCNRELWRIHFD